MAAAATAAAAVAVVSKGIGGGVTVLTVGLIV